MEKNISGYVNYIKDLETLNFITDESQKVMVDVTTKNGKHLIDVNSAQFGELITTIIYKHSKIILTSQELQSITTTLTSIAKYEEKLTKWETHKRVGVDECGCTVYKLTKNLFVQFDENGVELVGETTAKFKEINIKDQVKPNLKVENFNLLDTMCDFFNCSSLEDCIILLTWIMYTLKPNKIEIPVPILLFNGDSGTGKSTALRLLASIISPEEIGVETLTTVDKLALISSNSFMTTFDNVGKLSEAMQKELIRTTTTTNATYTADTKFKNNVPFTVRLRTLLALAGDDDILQNHILLNDCILIRLVDSEDMLSYDVMAQKFNRILPNLLGEIFNMMPRIYSCYYNKPPVKNEKFADFIRFGESVTDILSEDYDEEFNFRDYFNDNGFAKKLAVTEASDLVSTLIEFCKEYDFEGTATTLNRQLAEFAKAEDMDYLSREANVLSREIKKHKKILEELGLTIENKKSKNRILTIKMANFDEEVM